MAERVWSLESRITKTAGGQNNQVLPAFFYAPKESNSSIKQNSPNVLFTKKKFKLLRLGAVDRS